MIDRGVLFAAARPCLRALPVVCRAGRDPARGNPPRGRPSRDGRQRAVAAARRGIRGPRLARSRRRAAAPARRPRVILAAAPGDRPALPAVDRRGHCRRTCLGADDWTGHFLAALVAKPRTASPSSNASGPRRALLLPEGAGIRMLPRRSTSWPLPPDLRHRARRSARDGDQERDPSPRGFCRARQRQRGSPSVEAAALWAQAARRAVRGGGTAASAEAGPTSRSAGTGAARVRRRPR